jgi:predicted nucleic acid-binding protein
VFLELELDQERADECEIFLNKVRKGVLRAITTGFHIDSILIIMENYGKSPSDLEIFLSSLLGYKGLEVYPLSILDRISATRWMDKLNLDLDDAIAYHVMKKLNVDKIVSYDRHFDSIEDITRLEPSQL